MTSRVTVGTALWLICTPALAQTQSAAPTHGPDIVVTGQRPSSKAEVRRLTSRVMMTGDASTAVARFGDPVCPSSIGMASAYNDMVAERIRDDARAAGIRVGKEGCQPNITVVFIDNGQALVREIRRAHGELFGDLDAYSVRKLVNDAGPIHGWTITQTTSRDDDPLRVGTTSSVRAPELQVRSASIIDLPTKRDIVATVLVIDISAAVGKGLNRIADYAAMRTLAQTRDPGAASGGDGTILHLFDQGTTTAPPTLTVFDRTYLHTLYEGSGTTPPFAKASMVAERINKALSTAVTTKQR